MQFKTLIEQKDNTKFLSSVFLSMGVTEATFTFSGSNQNIIVAIVIYTIVN